MKSDPRNWDLDDALVLKSCQGDSSSRNELFRRSRPYLLQLAMAQLSGTRGAMHMADDVVQEAQVGLLHRLGEIEPVVSGFKRYAHGVVRNVAIDHLKANRRRLPVKEDHRRAERALSGIGTGSSLIARLATSETGPATAVARADQLTRALRAIGELGELDREIVILAFFEGLRTMDVAVRLGGDATRGSVGMRITRAMRDIRTTLLLEEGRNGLASN